MSEPTLADFGIDPDDKDSVFAFLQALRARPDGARLRELARGIAKEKEEQNREIRRARARISQVLFQLSRSLAGVEMPGYSTGRIELGLRIEVRENRVLNVEFTEEPQFTDLRRHEPSEPKASSRRVHIGDRVVIRWERSGNPYEVITLGDGDNELHPQSQIGRQLVGASVGKTIQGDRVIGEIESIL